MWLKYVLAVNRKKYLSPITIKHDICLLLVGYLYSKLFILISVLVFNAHRIRKQEGLVTGGEWCIVIMVMMTVWYVDTNRRTTQFFVLFLFH